MTVLGISAACRTNRNHMTLCHMQSFPWIRTARGISPTQALTTLSPSNPWVLECMWQARRSDPSEVSRTFTSLQQDQSHPGHTHCLCTGRGVFSPTLPWLYLALIIFTMALLHWTSLYFSLPNYFTLPWFYMSLCYSKLFCTGKRVQEGVLAMVLIYPKSLQVMWVMYAEIPLGVFFLHNM